MREKPSSCAIRLICHPERSEGSAFTTEHLNYEILRFAQDDNGTQDDNGARDDNGRG